MAATTDTSSTPLPGPALRWSMRLLALVGLGLSMSLLVSTLTDTSVAGCGGEGSGCGAALASRWAYWLKIPVSALAGGVYLVVLACLGFVAARLPWQRRVAWWGLIACVVAALGTALWLIIQMFRLQGWCPYCLGIHTCGLILAILVTLRAPLRWRWADPELGQIGPAGVAVAVVLGLAGAGTLVAGQLTAGRSTLTPYESPPAGTEAQVVAGTIYPVPTESDRRPNRTIRFSELDITLSPDQLPVLGSRDARHFVVSLFDYTCKHCKVMHKHLVKVRQHFGDKLAIIALPIPLNAMCNMNLTRTHADHKYACALANMALRVWRCDPTKFEKFDEWLFARKEPPIPQFAEHAAEKLVGAEAFAKTKYDPWPRRRIDLNTKLHGRLPRPSLPVLLLKGPVFGNSASSEELIERVGQELGME